jgi:hypothetical protein
VSAGYYGSEGCERKKRGAFTAKTAKGAIMKQVFSILDRKRKITQR